MRIFSTIVLLCAFAIAGCKNNGANTRAAAKEKTPESTMKEITVGELPKLPKPDFQIAAMNCKGDSLEVVFRYSGGCEEHDFNAYFNGAWIKSLPPQAMIAFEHINPENDACRKLVTDTVVFNATPLQYSAAERVRVIWSSSREVETIYSY